MNYTINIIDTQNNTLITQLEKAVRGGARLIHQGANKKDGLVIVGSALELGIIAEKYVDGYLYDLFTGDETRYKVEIIDSNGVYIWQGHILPDEYSEPFTNTPVINITATDGLGRLKGKYLPEDFYKDEKSVIEIICACLKLTGLSLGVRFSPAIENYQQKDYNQIYIHTAEYKNKDKKDDAYSILDELLKDILCVVYQQDNYFNIEGINVRNLRVYKAKQYSINGVLNVFEPEVEITRLKKDINGIATPVITMQPPYGVINVSHEGELLSFPDTLTKEINDGWVVSKSATTPIYPTDWISNNDDVGYADAGDLKVGVIQSTLGGFYRLKARRYLSKNKKYKIKLAFSLEHLFKTYAEKTTAINSGYWTNPFFVTIRMNYLEGGVEKEKILYDNDYLNFINGEPFDISFNEDGEAESTFTFISNYYGLLDIRISNIYNPDYTPEQTSISRINFEEISLEEIAQEEDYTTQILLENDFTLRKDHDLNFGDDATGLSKAFRLKKLLTPGNIVTLPTTVRSSFQRDGFWWSTLFLRGANLIKDNINGVSVSGSALEILEVVYNYSNSDQHAIKTTNQIIAGTVLNVDVFDYNTVLEDRTYWEQWTDSFYKIERLRYADAVANVYKRGFDKAVPLIQSFNVKTNVKFNDFVVFNWRDTSEWMLNSCEWDIDQGFTDINIAKTYYAIELGQNIPPIVEAGNDIFISGGQDITTVYSEAFDYDGFITSYKWEEVTNNGAKFLNSSGESTVVTGLTGDFYTLRVTVTDNQGATSTDTVNIYRSVTVNVTLTNIRESSYTLNGNLNKEIDWRLDLSNSIGNSIINIQGVINTFLTKSSTRINIEKDGVNILNHERVNQNTNRDFSIFLLQGEQVIFKTFVNKQQVTGAIAKIEIKLTQGDFVEGTGQVTGLPITVINEIV